MESPTSTDDDFLRRLKQSLEELLETLDSLAQEHLAKRNYCCFKTADHPYAQNIKEQIQTAKTIDSRDLQLRCSQDIRLIQALFNSMTKDAAPALDGIAADSFLLKAPPPDSQLRHAVVDSIVEKLNATLQEPIKEADQQEKEQALDQLLQEEL